MAHMIPPTPKDFDEKSDEGLVFKALSKLPDDYYVFHSVAMTTVENNVIYEREIDFVVASRTKGILCIEAKNGKNIKFDGRVWRYGSGREMEHGGPYQQIASAKRSIISKIKSHDNPDVRDLYNKCKIMHAVFFFKMTQDHFDEIKRVGLPEDSDAAITMLADDLINPTKRIEEIFDVKLAREVYATQKSTMTVEDFNLLLDSVLCPTFNLIPSPRAKGIAMVERMNQLLYEQYRLLDFLEDQETAVINGAAGTGKTMIAVEKARRHSVDGEKVLFLCYNRMLCDNLIDTHKKSSDPSYSKQFNNVSFLTISKLTQLITGNFKDYDGLLEWLVESEGNPEKFGYKHVIVDEGQDFGLIDSAIDANTEAAKENCTIIDMLQEVALSCGGTFYLFYDKYQMIQGGYSAEYQLPDCIENSDCRLTLKCNCRNTKEIARTSTTTLREKKNKAIKPTVAYSWYEPVKPTMHLVNDDDEALAKLNSILEKYEKDEINDVVILTEGRIDYSLIADKLTEKDDSGFYYYKYNGKKYRFATCIKFKGLEADAIILTDLKKSSFEGKWGMEFYVGASRAKMRLDLICQLDESDYYDVVHALDPNAPHKNNVEKMRKILANTFLVDVEMSN